MSRQLDERRKRSSFVADVMMTCDVETVRPETHLADAARMLAKHRFGCLPVTRDEGSLVVGIVTEHDFLQLTAQLLDAVGGGA